MTSPAAICSRVADQSGTENKNSQKSASILFSLHQFTAWETVVKECFVPSVVVIVNVPFVLNFSVAMFLLYYSFVNCNCPYVNNDVGRKKFDDRTPDGRKRVILFVGTLVVELFVVEHSAHLDNVGMRLRRVASA